MSAPSSSPVRCWMRHVRRTVDGEVGAVIAAGEFIAGDSAIGGRNGWQTAKTNAALSDTGELSITFPNTAGADGILHRRRFAIFTQPDYRPGEEWIEVYREPWDLVAACTPYRSRKTRSTVELVGYDLAGLLTRFVGSELDVWDSHAPRDVFEHYTRAPAMVVGTDFDGFTGTPWESWTAPTGGVSVGPHGGPRIVEAASSTTLLSLPAAAIPAAPADCWLAEFRVRVVATPDVVDPGGPSD